jgi:Tfp pilus assembly protein PilF
MPTDLPSRVAWAGFFVLIIPAVVMGPWLPFVDLIGYVGMSSYPPKLSAGTYIVHYALSRLMLDLGIGAGGQIVIFYLLQAGGYFYVVQALLRQFIRHELACAVAIAFGVLASWDSMFLWGGPLAFSLAGLSLAMATLITVREIDDPTPMRRLGAAAFALGSMMCHPFAFPFVLLLGGLRWVFVPRAKVHSGLLVVAAVVFAFIIRADSVESVDLRFGDMVSFSATQVVRRVVLLVVADGQLAKVLFGSTPIVYWCYSVILGVIHLAGLVTAPVVAWKARDKPLQFLAVLISAVAVMYFTAAENSPLTQWPQRILTLYVPFTFVAGIAFPWRLISERRQKNVEPVSSTPDGARWLAPALVLGFVLAVQIPILRYGAVVRDNFVRLRDGLVQTGLRNTFIVFCNVDVIRPYYLRGVPFLLFSDPEMVRRNNIFFTEWHAQPRHPTRLAEAWFETGRGRMQGWLSVQGDRISLRLEPQPAGVVPLRLGNDEGSYGAVPAVVAEQAKLAGDLLAVGANRDAIEHYDAALRLAPKRADLLNDDGVALMRADRGPEAIARFRAALDVQPNSAEVHCNLAVVLAKTGALADSIAHFDAAIRLNPGAADWRVEFASVLVTANRPRDAVAQLQQALAINPNLPAARDALARLGATQP